MINKKRYWFRFFRFWCKLFSNSMNKSLKTNYCWYFCTSTTQTIYSGIFVRQPKKCSPDIFLIKDEKKILENLCVGGTHCEYTGKKMCINPLNISYENHLSLIEMCRKNDCFWKYGERHDVYIYLLSGIFIRMVKKRFIVFSAYECGVI